MTFKKATEEWDELPWQERVAARCGAVLVVVGGVAAIAVLVTVAVRLV